MSSAVPASVADVLALLDSVCVAGTDGERVGQVEALERLKAAAAALQVRVSAEFAVSQRARLSALGVPAEQAARSIGSQLALARRDSPSKGSRYLGLAEALVADMPHTLAALEHGRPRSGG